MFAIACVFEISITLIGGDLIGLGIYGDDRPIIGAKILNEAGTRTFILYQKSRIWIFIAIARSVE
jgi:hypothetical protein